LGPRIARKTIIIEAYDRERNSYVEIFSYFFSHDENEK